MANRRVRVLVFFVHYGWGIFDMGKKIFWELVIGYYIYAMKVWELKDMLFEIPEGMSEQEWDEVDVMMPLSSEFDGFFVSPCLEGSGYSELTNDDDEDNPISSFVLVPTGYFELEEGRVPPELN